ncbi:alcohol dehydrogenase catalytic domain-containing protein [Qaidamihabitans albus]|uniref:alcohol dehydrogenase catalytic domain-containing protein n=1 Tax=Qaidamihabitans albus TaxID=2795733 RepID=UPI0018F15FAC|nr:zinc-binding dehydrogenase [Qaidamihabitans albus]
MTTMRAIRLRAPGEVELARFDVPVPQRGEALVAVEACGVCGSDVHLVDGTTAAKLPIVLGHEAAGTVYRLGPDAAGPEPGTRVAVLPYVGCGGCGRCRAGRPQACPRRQVLGVDRPGAHADFLTVPAECLVPLPDEVPSAVGAILTDAVATPYHAVRRSGAVAGETAVVLGLGGLGLHAVALLTQVIGCTVIGVDPRPAARAQATLFGAATVLDPAAPDLLRRIREQTGDGADVAFEFVGGPDVVGTALRSLRPEGTCVVVGIGPERLALGLRQETLVGRELRLLGSFGCTASELTELVALVARGRLELGTSVSRAYRPEKFVDALSETREKRADSVRVVVTYC